MDLPAIVKRQIIMEYIDLYNGDRYGETWSLEDCINIFTYFYQRYSDIFGQDHPRMRNKSIRKILEDFPYIDDEELRNRDFDLSPDEYPTLIDAYFAQDFPDCDYSMLHFMSGKIRLLRYYEELY